MNNELYHYGVKGMKWGVRKSPEHSTFNSRRFRRASKAGNKDAADLTKVKKIESDKRNKQSVRNRKKQIRESRSNVRRNYTGSKRSAAVDKYRRTDINKMSDADLKKAVNRMNLELQYRNLTKVDIGFGKAKADAILGYGDTYNKGKKVVKTAVKVAARKP